MGPYKCPDCGTWWAGLEHRCATASTTAASQLQVEVRCTCTLASNGVLMPGTAECPLHWHREIGKITWNADGSVESYSWRPIQ